MILNEGFIIFLELNVKADQQENRYADCEACNIQEGKEFILF